MHQRPRQPRRGQPDRQERADLPAAGEAVGVPVHARRQFRGRHPLVEAIVTAPAKFAAPTGMPIHGVKTKPLRVMPGRARLADGDPARRRAELFTKFGQVYVSATYPGVVKAWHYHKQQVDNFACVAGMVKLVLVDTREDSPTQRRGQRILHRHAEPDCSCRCRTSSTTAGSASAPSRRSWSTCRPSRTTTRDPDEYRLEPHGTLPYDWTRKDG